MLPVNEPMISIARHQRTGADCGFQSAVWPVTPFADANKF